jgi:glycosylphosphatidylinositol transamidase (GPIT) subunit GPI8
MDFANLDLPPTVIYQLGAAFLIVVLLLLLIASFMSRSRVFCQYLHHMTGIELKPEAVRRIYKRMGRGGVRDHLIDLMIQEDLADSSRVVTPDSKPDLSIFDSKK